MRPTTEAEVVAARPAGPRARLAGRGPLRRAQLGAVVGARRRAGDRPRRRSGASRTTRRPASSPPRRRSRAAPSWRRSSRRAAGSSPAATAPPSASAASCSRAARAGTPAAGAGPRSTSRPSTSSPRPASWCAPSATENADLYWAARGAGPGFPGVVTRFHLRTLPAPAHVAQTVHAYALDDFDEVMTWLHETHASVADTVEIVALTKTDPTIAPEPVLLVTGLALVASPAEADAALAPFRTSPALDRALLVLDAVPDHARRAAQAPAPGQPRGPPLGGRQRLALGPASAVRAGDAPRVHHAAQRQGVHDLVLHGAAARAARHGVLAAVGDLPGVVRRVGVAGGRRALPRLARRRDGRPRAGHRRPVPRRQRPVPPPGAVHVRRGLAAAPGDPRRARPGRLCSSATSPAPTARPTATTGISPHRSPVDQPLQHQPARTSSGWLDRSPRSSASSPAIVGRSPVVADRRLSNTDWPGVVCTVHTSAPPHPPP